MQDFKQLDVWRKAYQLTLSVYEVTRSFPKEEVYGLTSQIRRAAISIPSNIAEGCVRDSSAELARFLRIAMGSACELEFQLMLSHDLEMMESEVYQRINRDRWK
jgi:four helix bundle protein